MTAKNIYRIIYILIGIAGLMIQFGIVDGTFHVVSLVYYTVLSNILCVLYFILRMIYDNKQSPGHSPFGEFILSVHTKYAVTMCILLTFLVYHFLLAPTFGTGPSQLSPHTISNYILHYIIPVMTLIDFLVFDKDKGKVKWIDTIRWMVIPLVYFIFILLRAPLAGNIGSTSSPYPYPFIDFTIQPATSVFINIGILFVVFLILGSILILIDYTSRRIAESIN